MKKILFPLLQSNKGGNILSAISICNKIDQKKFKPTILIISSKKLNKFSLHSLNLNKGVQTEIIYLDFYHKFFFLNFYLKIFKYLLKNKFNIVHTNDGFLNFNFSIFCFFLKIQHIIHLRNTDNSRRNYLSFILAKKIICISKFVKSKTPSFFNRKKIVLYNYVEFFNKKIKILDKHKKFIEKYKKKNFLLFISNIHKRKNPKAFIDLISNLDNRNDNYIGLMFFQSNNLQLQSLIKYIKLKKIEKKIYLFQNYPVHYWVHFVRKIKKKILFAPSQNEPLGRNLIESIFKNIFVIANNSGGHKEIVDKSNGILINNIYSNNLIDSIENIFDKYDKNFHIKKIKKKFIYKFRDRNYINKIEKIYLEK